jgi:PKD repeat protein
MRIPFKVFLCFLFLLIFIPFKINAQVTGGIDCDLAGVVCSNSETINDTFNFPRNPGKIEVTMHTSCWQKSESFPFWYTFTVAKTGFFEMTITPIVGFKNDWDFVLYETTNGCDTANSNVISCNASDDCSPTGISTSKRSAWVSCSGSSPNPWENTVTLDSGKVYSLIINPNDFPGAAFRLDFNSGPGAAEFLDVTAKASADKNIICAGDSINFTNLSVFPRGSKFKWIFGDGGTSTAFSPSHVYSTPGDYSAILKVYNESCGDADTIIQLKVVPALVPSLTATSRCFGDTVVFSSTSSGNPTSTTWAFGSDASISSATRQGPF